MDEAGDFSWSEVGARIRDRRLRKGMSQQALADAAAITQHGVFRVEAGETNPQIVTLRQIAAALGCCVRDLVVGMSEADPAVAEWYRRIRRIVESHDGPALRAMGAGIEAAEALLDRSGARPGLPPLRIKGQGRQSSADELFWQTGAVRTQSEAGGKTVARLATKAGKPFGHTTGTHGTKRKISMP